VGVSPCGGKLYHRREVWMLQQLNAGCERQLNCKPFANSYFPSPVSAITSA
jgi:hypothetical protein